MAVNFFFLNSPALLDAVVSWRFSIHYGLAKDEDACARILFDTLGMKYESVHRMMFILKFI